MMIVKMVILVMIMIMTTVIMMTLIMMTDDDYDVGDDSRPPQSFSALSDCLLFMI